jgi:glycosyltransferase involved in cell wall biosynthesis
MHVITGLYAGGGAETLLVRMLEELGEEGRQGHSVLSLRPKGPLAADIERLGVPVDGLGMGGLPSAGDPARLLRLARAVRASGADVVQTWMLHSNVLTGLTSRLSSRIPVVWGVHVSDVNRATLGTKAVIVQRWEAATSWFVPSRIVACSLASEEVMKRLHYRRSLIETIPNGFDVERFKPDSAARQSVREELGIGPGTTAIGHVARFHPIKGHATLLAAAQRVFEDDVDARLVLCGYGVTREDPELRALVEPLGDRVLLLGPRKDVPRVLNGFDFAVSSSHGEALPLAVGEAMASGLPMVATDAGDSAELVGETGLIVPTNDPPALAGAIREMLAAGPERRAELGALARERISSRYSMGAMMARYVEVWEEAAASRRSWRASTPPPQRDR